MLLSHIHPEIDDIDKLVSTYKQMKEETSIVHKQSERRGQAEEKIVSVICLLIEGYSAHPEYDRTVEPDKIKFNININ